MTRKRRRREARLAEREQISTAERFLLRTFERLLGHEDFVAFLREQFTIVPVVDEKRRRVDVEVRRRGGGAAASALEADHGSA